MEMKILRTYSHFYKIPQYLLLHLCFDYLLNSDKLQQQRYFSNSYPAANYCFSSQLGLDKANRRLSVVIFTYTNCRLFTPFTWSLQRCSMVNNTCGVKILICSIPKYHIQYTKCRGIFSENSHSITFKLSQY